jgi:transcriptional regulator with XRE-family HTH domain
MSEALKTWVTRALQNRGWSYRELARQANISNALVSRTLSGDVLPSADFCIKVAQALEVSPETVLRLAGILPPSPLAQPSDDSTLQELLELVRNLSPDRRQQVLEYVRFMYQQQDK